MKTALQTIHIQDAISTTQNCRYCLMCRHVCPVGHVTWRETLTPHGWGLLIQSVQRGLIGWDEDTVSALFSCSDCGLCRANCVTDQPLPTAIAAARAEVASAGLAPAAAADTARLLEENGHPFADQKPAGNGAVQRGEVALFVGDAAFFTTPVELEAARALLVAAGMQPVEIGVGRNNGMLASSLGFPQIAAGLVQATLDELAATGAKHMIVLSPGDYYMFDELMDERLGITWPEEVELSELTTILHERLAAGSIAFDAAGDEHAGAYAYVDPAHTARVADRHAAPRALLEAVLPGKGEELFWRKDRAHPPGGGALQFTQPAIAKQLGRSRVEDLAQTGAKLAITEDPISLNQLAEGAADAGIRLLGLYDLLAKHIRSN